MVNGVVFFAVSLSILDNSIKPKPLAIDWTISYRSVSHSIPNK